MSHTFRISTTKGKKYDVYLPDLDKWLPFGDTAYEHYHTSNRIPLSLHIYPEHHDDNRRRQYLARATKIRNRAGELVKDNKHSANYWSINYLW